MSETSEYQAGEKAAREVAAKLCTPFWEGVNRQSQAFQLGFRREWAVGAEAKVRAALNDGQYGPPPVPGPLKLRKVKNSELKVGDKKVMFDWIEEPEGPYRVEEVLEIGEPVVQAGDKSPSVPLRLEYCGYYGKDHPRGGMNGAGVKAGDWVPLVVYLHDVSFVLVEEPARARPIVNARTGSIRAKYPRGEAGDEE